MIDFFIKGGILMYPIFLCSIFAIAIFIERFIYLTIVDIRNKKFLERVKKLRGNDTNELRRMSSEISSPLSTLLFSAIENVNRPEGERNLILNRVGAREIKELEKNINLLDIIIRITPLLGLLGTVTGMIRCFMTIQKLGGQVDAVKLAGGIWEALITTAAGLFVAIPALIFYHFLESKIDNIVLSMRDLSLLFPEIFSKYQIKQAKQIMEQFEEGNS